MKPFHSNCSIVLAPLAAISLIAVISGAAFAETRPGTGKAVSAVTRSGIGITKPAKALRTLSSQTQSVLLKDLATGETLYSFQANSRVPPASLTKIMSALIILERGQLSELVTVSRKASLAPKTHLRLKAGQVFRLEDLVKAMLITSANDACLAAVEHAGGSEESFVELMNAKAHGMGLADTHFANGCGFDGPAHYSTASDLAILTEVAMSHPLFKSYVGSTFDVITSVNTNRSYALRNTNRLLGRMPGVEGVKTGFTTKAGRCLVAKVSQNGKDLLLVLLNSRRRWNTATSLLNTALQLHGHPASRVQ